MCKQTWLHIYKDLHMYAQVCTRVHACDTRVKQVSHACGVELVANLYHIILLHVISFIHALK